MGLVWKVREPHWRKKGFLANELIRRNWNIYQRMTVTALNSFEEASTSDCGWFTPKEKKRRNYDEEYVPAGFEIRIPRNVENFTLRQLLNVLENALRSARECREKVLNPLFKESVKSEMIGRKIRSILNFIDSIVIKGNLCPTYIDLHQMSVKGALNFVRSHITRRDVIGKEIFIVTGAGKGSKSNRPTIRETIANFFYAQNIKFDYKNEEGAIQVKIPRN